MPTTFAQRRQIYGEFVRQKMAMRSQMLQQGGWWLVDYIKVDGTRAHMRCTLTEIRDDQRPSGRGRRENEMVLPVFASHSSGKVANGWRSFRILNVQNFVREGGSTST